MSDWRRIDLRRSARRGVATLSRRLVAWGHQTDDEERRRQWSARLGTGLSIGRNARVTEMELRVFSAEPGRLAVGDLTYVRGTLVLFLPESSITIGARSQLNGGIVEAATSVTIGDDVLIGREVIILDHDGHSLSWSERQHDAVRALRGEKDWRVVDRAPVHICDKAWLGARVLVLKGVTIGTGAVVGAGSVVTKDVPAWTVVAGNPARVVRELAAGERG